MMIDLVDVSSLKHIEGFSQKRVEWLREKIVTEKIWKKPIALDSEHGLVLDGQHRMEVALALRLDRVPAVRFSYEELTVWSLRPTTHEVTWQLVVERALSGQIYPYKTVKHSFPNQFPSCSYSLKRLGFEPGQ